MRILSTHAYKINNAKQEQQWIQFSYRFISYYFFWIVHCQYWIATTYYEMLFFFLLLSRLNNDIDKNIWNALLLTPSKSAAISYNTLYTFNKYSAILLYVCFLIKNKKKRKWSNSITWRQMLFQYRISYNVKNQLTNKQDNKCSCHRIYV